MARITLGSGISSINGSIGGTTYQSSNAGTIAKNKGARVRRLSAGTGRVSSIITTVQQGWSILSAATRAEWEAYAIFKQVPQKNNPNRYLNGQQLFALYNYSYYFQFGGLATTPNFVTDAIPDNDFTIHFDTGSLYVRSNNSIDEGDFFVNFKISAQLKASRQKSVGGLKQIKCTFGGGTEQDITTAYTQLYGTTPIIGSYVEISTKIFCTTIPTWGATIEKKVNVQPY